MFGAQLLVGTAMIGLTVIVHVGGIIVATTWLRSCSPTSIGHNGYASAIRIFVATVLGIFFLHTIEIWSWALLYLGLGQFETIERALYFSTVTFTTLGYGDITLEPRWQLLSSLEAVNGIILFGVSTAFVFAVLRHLFEEAGIVKRK